MMRNFKAFTLGEVLITLGVIGVVAALVLPGLINGHKAGVAKAQFDTAYSMIAKSLVEMEADNVPIEPVKYTTAGSFYPVFKQYHKYTIDCGKYGETNDSVCISTTTRDNDADKYYRFDGAQQSKSAEASLLDDGCIVVNNGMMFCVENPNNIPYGLLIMVDINGKNKHPNRLGYDLFAFEIVKGGQLLPVGAPGTGQGSAAKNIWGKDSDAVDKYCNKDNKATWNGMTCAYFAATDKEYFQKLYDGH